jgi:hypothetical protein
MRHQRLTTLLGLFGPLEVVRAWLDARQLEYDSLDALPELNLLQRVVEPAGGDAEEGLVRRDMVNAVVNARQNDVHVLQDCDVEWKTKVGMRPFVNLKLVLNG